MSTPQVGDRVRIGYEGEVTSISSISGLVRVKRDDDTCIAIRQKYITVIEPAYDPGTLWIDAVGTAYYRLNKDNASRAAWRLVSNGAVCDNACPVRPLTRLVPES